MPRIGDIGAHLKAIFKTDKRDTANTTRRSDRKAPRDTTTRPVKSRSVRFVGEMERSELEPIEGQEHPESGEDRGGGRGNLHLDQCLDALSKTSKNIKRRIASRHQALEQADHLCASAALKGFGGVLDTIRLRDELGRALSGHKPRELKRIIRNALEAHFAADQHCAGESKKAGDAAEDDADAQEAAAQAQKATGQRRELVMKMVVEACLDRLSLKVVDPLHLFHPSIDDRFLRYALTRWVLEPAQKFVAAMGNDPDRVVAECERLIHGYKAFGCGHVAGALFDAFGDRGSDTMDGMMGEVARRARALESEVIRRARALKGEATNIPLAHLHGDLYSTARIMRNAAWAYFVRRQVNYGQETRGLSRSAALRSAKKVVKGYSVEPQESDKLWAKNYYDGRLPPSDQPPRAPEESAAIVDEPKRKTYREPGPRPRPQQSAPVGVLPQRAVPMTDFHRVFRLGDPQQAVLTNLAQRAVLRLGDPQQAVLTDMPPPQRAVRIKGEANYRQGHKRLGDHDWEPFPLSARPVVDNALIESNEELVDRPEIARAQLRVSAVSLGAEELGSATLSDQQLTVPDPAERSPSPSYRKWVRDFMTALERNSESAENEGIDVDAVAEALVAQPPSILENFVRLYDALDIAMGRIHENDPSYEPPAYFAIANALRIRFGEILVVPGVDEALIEAAREVLQENAELDALVAELERVQQTQIRTDGEIAGARLDVSQARLEEVLGSARLPGHNLLVIENTLEAIWYGDTERYILALARIGQMDATTTPMAIQGTFLERPTVDRQRISKAAQILHRRLVEQGVEPAMLELSRQIGDMVGDVATRDETAIDASPEKSADTTVSSSAGRNAAPAAAPRFPASPPRLSRRKKPADLVRSKATTSLRRKPQVEPGDSAIAEQDRPGPVTAMRNAIDKADVAAFLEGLDALARMDISQRTMLYSDISGALRKQPPQQASVRRLNAVMQAIGKDRETAGTARQRFEQVDRGWMVLQVMNPGLRGARRKVMKDDFEAAKTFFAGPAGAGSKPQSRVNPSTK